MNNTKFTAADDLLLAELLSDAPKIENDITKLVHVKPRSQVQKEQRAQADFVAQREACQDFELYRPIFARIGEYLARHIVRPERYKSAKSIRPNACFIVFGQYAFIENIGEWFTNNGVKDARLRVIFDNGTECRLLFRSFQKSLASDKASMVIC